MDDCAHEEGYDSELNDSESEDEQIKKRRKEVIDDETSSDEEEGETDAERRAAKGKGKVGGKEKGGNKNGRGKGAAAGQRKPKKPKVTGVARRREDHNDDIVDIRGGTRCAHLSGGGATSSATRRCTCAASCPPTPSLMSPPAPQKCGRFVFFRSRQKTNKGCHQRS